MLIEQTPNGAYYVAGTFQNTFNFYKSTEISAIIIPIVQMRKLRHQEIKLIVQS